MQSRLPCINDEEIINVRLYSKDSNDDEVIAHPNHRLGEASIGPAGPDLAKCI